MRDQFLKFSNMRWVVVASLIVSVCPVVHARPISSVYNTAHSIEEMDIFGDQKKSNDGPEHIDSDLITDLTGKESLDFPADQTNRVKTESWWLTPLLSSSRATTYDIAIIVTNSTIFAIGTGSIFAGVAQGIYNSAKSYFIVNANELAWDYFDPPDRTSPFNLKTSFWNAAKHQATYRPVDTVFKYLGLLVSVEPETAVVYSLISAASSTTVFIINHIAWDLALHPSSEDPLSRFFKGFRWVPSEAPPQRLERGKTVKTFEVKNIDEDVEFIWPTNGKVNLK